jgi:hypothetical protein
MIKPPGVALLNRWGLHDPLMATSCPPIRDRRVQFGDRPASNGSAVLGGTVPVANVQVVRVRGRR